MNDEDASANDPSKPTAAADESEGSEENAPHVEGKPDDAGKSAGDIPADEAGEGSGGGSPSGDPEKSPEDVPAEGGSKSSYVPSSEENKG